MSSSLVAGYNSAILEPTRLCDDDGESTKSSRKRREAAVKKQEGPFIPPLHPHSSSTPQSVPRRQAPAPATILLLATVYQGMGGVYSRVRHVQSLRPGDHIAIWDTSRWPISYQHHGIVWASGETASDIKVCHVWSPLEGYQEAQADSCFRISTLEEFLYKRGEKNLRLVEYHTSGMREVLSRWGEVHLSKSDLPEVVLARCKFLLGLGKGDFNIFKQNCEHAAHWCMTGEQWCKQNLTKVKGRVPFENRLAKEDVDALEREIEEIKTISRSVVDSVLKLSGSKVFLRVKGNHYVHILDDGRVGVVHQGDDPTKCGRTAFRLECYSKGYNCIKVSFYHEESDAHMFSRSTFSCFRDLRMKHGNWVRGTSGLKWDYSSAGNLKSMNQHRRYVGVRDDNILVDVSMRSDATRFEFVPCEPTPHGGDYKPPDINCVTRAYNHDRTITHMESRSMRDFEDAVRKAAAGQHNQQQPDDDESPYEAMTAV